MSYFMRAEVDRASLDGNRPIRFVAVTEGRKADGIDLPMRAAKLDRFRANPIVLYGHVREGRDNLPIGRVVDIAIEGDRMLMDTEYDQDDPDAVKIERKIRGGYLNAVSIGFNVTKWDSPRGNYMTGGVAAEWEPTELSVVTVPLDYEAVAVAGRSFHLSVTLGQYAELNRTDAGRALVDAIVAYERAQNPTPIPIEPVAIPEAPAPAVLDPDAVCALLAALTPKGASND